VPDDFRFSVTFPIPKGSKNSVSKCSNDYSGISISTIISKIYEYCLLDKLKSFLNISPLQFGFNEGVGCTQVIHTLQKTVDYFIERGSNVHLCALDLSKALDKLDRYILIEKLIKQNCRTKFIAILENWFSDTYSSVVWNNSV